MSFLDQPPRPDQETATAPELTRCGIQSGLGLSSFRELLTSRGIQLVLHDLDMTLVDSRPLYVGLEIATARNFGFHDAAAIRQRHNETEHLSSREIMRALYEVCGGWAGTGVEFEKFDGYFSSQLSAIFAGDIEPEIPPEEIPGARKLVEVVSDLCIPQLITTGARPHGAKVLLIHSGLEELFTPKQIKTVSEIGSDKSTLQFWKAVLGDSDPQYCLGLEDNAEAARWMIEVGKLGTVLVRPSRDGIGALLELKREYPDILFIEPDWTILTKHEGNSE